MAGALRKTMIYLGLADGDEHYESEHPTPHKDEDESMEQDREERRAPAPVREVPREEPHAAEEEYRAPVTPIKRAASSREEPPDSGRSPRSIPRSYNDAKLIGESFRDGIPVIMNVTDMGEADAKRLVDFSAGPGFRAPGQHRTGHQQGFPAVAVVRRSHRRRQEGQRNPGKLLQPELARNPSRMPGRDDLPGIGAE